jgi:hypothetical protein
MYENHRTREDAVKASSSPNPARTERLAAASIAGYILALAKAS